MSDLLSGLTDPGANAVGLGGYVHKDAVREALLSRIEELRDEPHPDWFLMGWNAALNRIECWATDTAAGGDDERM